MKAENAHHTMMPTKQASMLMLQVKDYQRSDNYSYHYPYKQFHLTFPLLPARNGLSRHYLFQSQYKLSTLLLNHNRLLANSFHLHKTPTPPAAVPTLPVGHRLRLLYWQDDPTTPLFQSH